MFRNTSVVRAVLAHSARNSARVPVYISARRGYSGQTQDKIPQQQEFQKQVLEQQAPLEAALKSAPHPEVADSAALADKAAADATVEDTAIEETANEGSNIPWYMRDDDEDTSFVPQLQKFEMPELPRNAPPSLEKIVAHMGGKLSLDDIVVLDMTRIDPSERRAASEYADYMVISSGKSNKHTMKAGTLLYKYVKGEFGNVPHVEGLVKETAKMSSKRLKKSIRKQGRSGVDGYYGDAAATPNSWIMLESKVDNVYVHILTPERREELNLEYLWAPKSEKHKYRRKPRASAQYSDDIFAGVRYYHTLLHGRTREQAQKQLEVFAKQHPRQPARHYSSTAKEPISYEQFFKLSDEEVLSVFDVNDKPLTSALREDVAAKFKDPRAAVLAADIRSLVRNNAHQDEEVEKAYNFYERIFILNSQLIAPNVLYELVMQKLLPLEDTHLAKLTASFLQSHQKSCYSFKDYHKYLAAYMNCASEFLKRYAAQGNGLDFSKQGLRESFLNLSKIILNTDLIKHIESTAPNHEDEDEDDVTHLAVHTNHRLVHHADPRFFELPLIVAANARATLQRVQADPAAHREFLLFKNELLLNYLNFYAFNGYWEDFWSLWKNKELAWVPNIKVAKNNQQDKLNSSQPQQQPATEQAFEYIDSRPWSGFLTLCRLTGNVKTIEGALDYWTKYYQVNNLEKDEDVRRGIDKLLRFVDPENQRYPLTRKQLAMVEEARLETV